MATTIAPLVSVSGPAAQSSVHPVVFEYHSGFLMNLHSFLLDAAIEKRALSTYPWVVKPSEAELQALTNAVAFYQTNYGQRHLLFDAMMTDIKKALSGDDARRDARGLSLPPDLAAVLNQVSPIYARCLWPAHDKINLDWILKVRALNAQYGTDIQAGIEHYLGHPFQPTPIREDIVVETGSFLGGYTDTQTVLPSGRSDYEGLAALEMLYHEAAHIDVADTLTDAIDKELQATGRSSNQLWHAVQFYTVGEVVKDVLKRGQVRYETYADKNGVYTRGDWPAYHAAIEAEWRPYLHGEGTMQSAIKAMVNKLPPSSSGQK
jgi:hypothetical protein